MKNSIHPPKADACLLNVKLPGDKTGTRNVLTIFLSTHPFPVQATL